MIKLLGMGELSEKIEKYSEIGLDSDLFRDETDLYKELVKNSRLSYMSDEFPEFSYFLTNIILVVKDSYFKQNYRDLKKTGAFKNFVIAAGVGKYRRSLYVTTESKNILFCSSPYRSVFDKDEKVLYRGGISRFDCDINELSLEDLSNRTLDDFCTNSLVLYIKRKIYIFENSRIRSI